MAEVAHAEPVHETDAAGHGYAAQHVAQRGEVGHVQTALVDPPDATRRDGDSRRGPDHEGVEGLALLHVVHFRVVETRQGPHLPRRQALVVEEHRRRDQRTGEAAPPRLVGSGHEAVAELAVELEEASRRPAALRGSRCVGEASRWRRLGR
jgi:hypothetical protein